METLKYYDDITTDDRDLFGRREEYLKNVIENFYQKVKSHSNVLSADEVYNLCDRVTFFSTSIFYNKIAIRSQYSGEVSHRAIRPVIFGLKSGIVFKKDEVIFFTGKEPSDEWDMSIIWLSKHLQLDGNIIKDPRYSHTTKESTKEDIETLQCLIEELNSVKSTFNRDIDKERLVQNKQEEKRLMELEISVQKQLEELETDENNQLILLKNDFDKLLVRHQKDIILIDKNYIHQFVKVSNFIKIKRENTQSIFETICKSKDDNELNERVNLLKNQIHAFNLLIFHSLNLITSLLESDLVTFYEIYESFDKLGMYNSNWENQISDKLKNIETKLDDLMISIYQMELTLVHELSQLKYITQESFKELNSNVTKQLSSIESSINFNNLLTGIQTYQLYKINKNTKTLR